MIEYPFRAFASYRGEKSQKSRKYYGQILALPGEFQKKFRTATLAR